MNTLTINHVSFQYDDKEILHNINKEFQSGKIYAILGESGVGKTTLHSIILNLVKYKGSVYYNQYNTLNIQDFRKQYISYIDQDASYFDNMTILQHFQFISELMQKKFHIEDVHQCLSDVHLQLPKLTIYPSKLSGGERRKLLLALALYKDTDIILLDEPTSNLDDESTKIYLDILKTCRNKDKIIIMVTHDLRVVDEVDDVSYINELHDDIKVIEKDIEKNSYQNHYYISLNHHNRRQMILLILLILLGIFMVNQSSSTLLKNMRSSQVISDRLNDSIVNEIHVRKRNFDTSIVDGFREYLSVIGHQTVEMTDKEINTIRNIDGVTDIGTFPILHTGEYEVNEDIVDTPLSINVDGVDKPVENVVAVGPVYGHDDMFSDGMFKIDSEFAKSIGINNSSFDQGPIDITLLLGIPCGQYQSREETTFSKEDDDGNFKEFLTLDLDYLNVVYRQKEVTIKVSGLCESHNNYSYFFNGYPFIVGNVDMINHLIKEYQEPIKDKKVKEYHCEDYIVFVSSVDKLQDISLKIQELDPLYDVYVDYLNSREMGGIEIINRQSSMINNVMIGIECIGAFSLIFYHYYSLKRKSYKLLGIYGVKRKELLWANLSETGVILIIVLLTNIIYTAILSNDWLFYTPFMLKGYDLLIQLSVIEGLYCLVIFILCITMIHSFIKGYQYD